uniref:Uncharacterized protein n=1 Tax=Tetraselmis sp. GSL018 TaxID=582737 RepID=A0A061S115_9CHLO
MSARRKTGNSSVLSTAVTNLSRCNPYKFPKETQQNPLPLLLGKVIYIRKFGSFQLFPQLHTSVRLLRKVDNIKSCRVSCI